MYTPILAALAYIVSPDGGSTLLVHRNKRKNDHHFGKFNGLGGKMEPSEDIVSCLQREIREEASIDAQEIVLRGTINWTGFGGEGMDWFGFIFLVRSFKGSPCSTNAEGDLVWKKIAELETLPMWEGDRLFLPLVFDDDPRVFHGYMPYCNGKPAGWYFSRL
ncbi:MAG: 8-oxo-dGTP diphosphatase [Desulfopila sp.]|nr:8-oxo-dGTP diphosphatase [Desulfopila sp.]